MKDPKTKSTKRKEETRTTIKEVLAKILVCLFFSSINKGEDWRREWFSMMEREDEKREDEKGRWKEKMEREKGKGRFFWKVNVRTEDSEEKEKKRMNN